MTPRALAVASAIDPIDFVNVSAYALTLTTRVPECRLCITNHQPRRLSVAGRKEGKEVGGQSVSGDRHEGMSLRVRLRLHAHRRIDSDSMLLENVGTRVRALKLEDPIPQMPIHAPCKQSTVRILDLWRYSGLTQDLCVRAIR